MSRSFAQLVQSFEFRHDHTTRAEARGIHEVADMSQYTSGQGGEAGSPGGQSSSRGANAPHNGPKKKVTSQVKQGATEAVSQVKDQASSAVKQQQQSAADKLRSVGQAIRDSAHNLEDQHIPGSQFISQAAESIEKFSNVLREGDLHDLVDTVENWARRHPAMFLGGSLLAGVLLARFIKSSREHDSAGFESDRDTRFSSMASESRSRYGREFGEAESQYASGSTSPTASAPGMTVPGSGSSGTGSIGARGPSSTWEEES